MEKNLAKKTYELSLTKAELVHIRDLFGVMLPPDLKMTLSQSLAFQQGRSLIETNLWNKIVKVCGLAEIELGDAAPDFVVTAVGPPPLQVLEIGEQLQNTTVECCEPDCSDDVDEPAAGAKKSIFG